MTGRTPHAEPEPGDDEHRYRPGRGGYDPEAAALAARARYAFRQRVVVGLFLAAVATLLLALLVKSGYWWAHAAFDLLLVGYLGYLRRQVRIEDEVRRRRAERLSTRTRRPAQATEQLQHGVEYPGDGDGRETDRHDVADVADVADVGGEAVVRAAPPPMVQSSGVAVDLDDEDPAFDELEPAFERPYRRAVGE